MRRYERSGINVDQCADCRGIFLDAGELERIMQAEEAHYRNAAQAPPPPQQPAGYPQPGYPPQDPYVPSIRHSRRTESPPHSLPNETAADNSNPIQAAHVLFLDPQPATATRHPSAID